MGLDISQALVRGRDLLFGDDVHGVAKKLVISFDDLDCGLQVFNHGSNAPLLCCHDPVRQFPDRLAIGAGCRQDRFS
jgi:hypothetical protein